MRAVFDNIRDEVIKSFSLASQSIYIAVAWFTDYELAQILLLKANQGVKIVILTNDDEINKRSSYFFNKLQKSGVELRKFCNDGLLMHNKFFIIDSQLLITGSYNLTNKARSNSENILIAQDQELINEYLNHFWIIFEKTITFEIKNNALSEPNVHNDYPLIIEPNEKEVNFKYDFEDRDEFFMRVNNDFVIVSANIKILEKQLGNFQGIPFTSILKLKALDILEYSMKMQNDCSSENEKLNNLMNVFSANFLYLSDSKDMYFSDREKSYLNDCRANIYKLNGKIIGSYDDFISKVELLGIFIMPSNDIHRTLMIDYYLYYLYLFWSQQYNFKLPSANRKGCMLSIALFVMLVFFFWGLK